MTKEKIEILLKLRAELNIERLSCISKLKMISDMEDSNNATCDHLFEDGKLAQKDHWFCHICGGNLTVEQLKDS